MSIDIEYKGKSGIYKIISKIDTRFYIGSAHCLYTRGKVHYTLLKQGIHTNIRLQRFVNKYSLENIDFFVIEVCDKNILIEREQYYMDILKPSFNVCPIAQNSAGYKFTKEQSEYSSKIRKGKYPESCRNKNNTPEARLKISIKARQRGLHPIFMAASIKANTGRKQTPEEIEKRVLKQVKLTSEQVKEIRYLLSMGIYQHELATQFNVSQRVICRVNNRVGIYDKL